MGSYAPICSSSTEGNGGNADPSGGNTDTSAEGGGGGIVGEPNPKRYLGMSRSANGSSYDPVDFTEDDAEAVAVVSNTDAAPVVSV